MEQNKTLLKLIKKLGPFQRRNNGEYGFECPKCSHHVGKFHMGVNLNKGLFNCFRCGYSGHVRKLGVDLNNVKDRKVELKERLDTPELPKFASLKSKRIPADIKLGIKRFLLSRGVSLERAEKMRIGYSFEPFLSDRFLIPILEGGLCHYWVARLIATEVPSRASGRQTYGVSPKEIGPRNGLGWQKRSDVLYGLDEVPEGVKIVLVEGIFDAEHLKSLGYYALSTLGSNLSDVQVGKILAKSPASITIFYDGDEGGRKGAKRARELLRTRYRGPISCVDLPDGEDPDECGPERIKRYLDGT